MHGLQLVTPGFYPPILARPEIGPSGRHGTNTSMSIILNDESCVRSSWVLKLLAGICGGFQGISPPSYPAPEPFGTCKPILASSKLGRT